MVSFKTHKPKPVEYLRRLLLSRVVDSCLVNPIYCYPMVYVHQRCWEGAYHPQLTYCPTAMSLTPERVCRISFFPSQPFTRSPSPFATLSVIELLLFSLTIPFPLRVTSPSFLIHVTVLHRSDHAMISRYSSFSIARAKGDCFSRFLIPRKPSPLFLSCPFGAQFFGYA